MPEKRTGGKVMTRTTAVVLVAGLLLQAFPSHAFAEQFHRPAMAVMEDEMIRLNALEGSDRLLGQRGGAPMVPAAVPLSLPEHRSLLTAQAGAPILLTRKAGQRYEEGVCVKNCGSGSSSSGDSWAANLSPAAKLVTLLLVAAGVVLLVAIAAKPSGDD